MIRSSKRTRVLLMIDHVGTPGGAERFVLGLALHLPRERVEPWVCSTRTGEPRAISALSEAGIRHVELNRRSRWEAHRLGGLASLLRTERFDVLHAHKFGSNIWGTLLGRAFRVPVILAHEHNWSYDGARARVWLDGHLIGKLATRFIAVSPANRERMITVENIPSSKVVVMPTGYVPHPEVTEDIRGQLGLGPDVLLVATAAGLRVEKALDVLIDAHGLLVEDIPDAHLAIAGDGPCRGELEDQIRRLGLEHRVHLLGMRRDVDSILRGADIGALSSDWEGMPLFVFECMAARTPLVATAVGGLPHVVQDGRTGLLVPPRDPAALAGALKRLLTDRTLAMELAHTASQALGHFTIDAVAARFADLYEQLLEQASRA